MRAGERAPSGGSGSASATGPAARADRAQRRGRSPSRPGCWTWAEHRVRPCGKSTKAASATIEAARPDCEVRRRKGVVRPQRIGSRHGSTAPSASAHATAVLGLAGRRAPSDQGCAARRHAPRGRAALHAQRRPEQRAGLRGPRGDRPSPGRRGQSRPTTRSPPRPTDTERQRAADLAVWALGEELAGQPARLVRAHRGRPPVGARRPRGHAAPADHGRRAGPVGQGAGRGPGPPARGRHAGRRARARRRPLAAPRARPGGRPPAGAGLHRGRATARGQAAHRRARPVPEPAGGRRRSRASSPATSRTPSRRSPAPDGHRNDDGPDSFAESGPSSCRVSVSCRRRCCRTCRR